MFNQVRDEYRVASRPISIVAKQPSSITPPIAYDTPTAITQQITQLGSAPISLGPKNSGLATNPTGAATVQVSGAKSSFLKTYAPQIIVGVIVAIAGAFAVKKF